MTRLWADTALRAIGCIVIIALLAGLYLTAYVYAVSGNPCSTWYVDEDRIELSGLKPGLEWGGELFLPVHWIDLRYMRPRYWREHDVQLSKALLRSNVH